MRLYLLPSVPNLAHAPGRRVANLSLCKHGGEAVWSNAQLSAPASHMHLCPAHCTNGRSPTDAHTCMGRFIMPDNSIVPSTIYRPQQYGLIRVRSVISCCDLQQLQFQSSHQQLRSHLRLRCLKWTILRDSMGSPDRCM